MEASSTRRLYRASVFRIVGGLYLDEILEVEAFPQEDSTTRAVSYRRARGGNAATNCVVLATLGNRVWWMGAIPKRDEPSAAFCLRELTKYGVDASSCEEVGDEAGMPTATVVLSRATGSRTIISTRRGCRELSVEHFSRSATLPALPSGEWLHFEVRESCSVLAMARAAREQNRPQPAVLSVEIEKPSLNVEAVVSLLQTCDVAFFSRDWVVRHSQELVRDEQSGDRLPKDPIETLRALHQKSEGKDVLYICGWGANGAYAIDVDNRAYHEPAHPPPSVVESVGAGDTFIAATMHALSTGAEVAEALCCGCAVAGRKVGQVGLAGLKDALGSTRSDPQPAKRPRLESQS